MPRSIKSSVTWLSYVRFALPRFWFQACAAQRTIVLRCRRVQKSLRSKTCHLAVWIRPPWVPLVPTGLRPKTCRYHLPASMVALTIALALLCAVTSRAELTIPAHKLRQRISLSKAESKLQVPKIIHQSWKTDSVPDRFLKWQESWKTTHPDWEYR